MQKIKYSITAIQTVDNIVSHRNRVFKSNRFKILLTALVNYCSHLSHGGWEIAPFRILEQIISMFAGKALIEQDWRKMLTHRPSKQKNEFWLKFCLLSSYHTHHHHISQWHSISPLNGEINQQNKKKRNTLIVLLNAADMKNSTPWK